MNAAPGSWVQRWRGPACLALASLLPLYGVVYHHEWLNDDTYITLAYVKNLVAGHGFVFNAPPPTLGTTTPLLALLVAGAGVLWRGADLVLVAVTLTALCWIGCGWLWLVFHQAWGLTRGQAVLVGLVVILSGWNAYLGMEAYLFAFLLVLACSLFYAGHDFLAGLITGLLFLTRGEGALVAGLLAAIGFLFPRSGSRLLSPARVAAGFLAPILLWALYAQATFGRVLPDTLAAKQAQAASGSWPLLSTRLFVEWVPSWQRQFALLGSPFLNLWWVLVAAGVWRAARRQPRWLIWPVWMVLYVAAYSALRVPAYWWYQAPVTFALHLSFALGLLALVEGLGRLARHPRWGWGGRLQWAPVIAAALALAVLGRPLVQSELVDTSYARGRGYLALAGWLNANTRPVESVAYIEVGYLGYYTDNRIIDLGGLVTPDIAPHVAQHDFAWGFWHYQPDYYVWQPDFDWALGTIRADPRFAASYESIATVPGFGQPDLIIYRRKR
jgi:arabinofuranosyltransferase